MGTSSLIIIYHQTSSDLMLGQHFSGISPDYWLASISLFCGTIALLILWILYRLLFVSLIKGVVKLLALDRKNIIFSKK